MKQTYHASIYLWKDKIYIPSEASAGVGLTIELSPVGVVGRKDRDGFKLLLEKRLSEPMQRIATPTTRPTKKPVILDATGAKSWRAFHANARLFSVSRTDFGFEFGEWVKDDRGSWLPPGSTCKIESNTTDVEQVVDKILLSFNEREM